MYTCEVHLWRYHNVGTVGGERSPWNKFMFVSGLGGDAGDVPKIVQCVSSIQKLRVGALPSYYYVTYFILCSKRIMNNSV